VRHGLWTDARPSDETRRVQLGSVANSWEARIRVLQSSAVPTRKTGSRERMHPRSDGAFFRTFSAS